MIKSTASHFDEKKWSSLTFNEQMGNIGSEVGRVMNAIERGDEQAMAGAHFRGLDLIDSTVKNLNVKGRRRELLRVREQFSEAVEKKSVDQKLEDYFMAFALLARA